MKILNVVFTANTSSGSYNYIYNGDVDVEPGDYAVANNSLTEVKAVVDPKDYKPTVPTAALEVLKTVKYVISRKEEREEKKRVARINEIKETLNNLKDRALMRRELEAAAGTVGDEGKKLLAELEELEGKI